MGVPEPLEQEPGAAGVLGGGNQLPGLDPRKGHPTGHVCYGVACESEDSAGGLQEVDLQGGQTAAGETLPAGRGLIGCSDARVLGQVREVSADLLAELLFGVGGDQVRGHVARGAGAAP